MTDKTFSTALFFKVMKHSYLGREVVLLNPADRLSIVKSINLVREHFAFEYMSENFINGTKITYLDQVKEGTLMYCK